MDKGQFFIGIIPPHGIEEEVHGVKREIHQKYGLKGAFRSKAHITLQMPFTLSNKKIPALIEDLNRLVKTEKNFTIQLNDYGSFGSRVVYLQVEENPMLNLFQKKISRQLKDYQIFNDTHRNNGFVPHITVAFRDLRKPVFDQLWSTMKTRRFQRSFNAEKITLFKHNGSTWDVHTEVYFAQ